MIHLSSMAVEENNLGTSDWKQLLRNSRMSTQDLLAAVGLKDHALACHSAERFFELRAPLPYLQKIEKGKPDDPLLLQILPQKAEHARPDGFSGDPLDEQRYSPAKGLIHKYHKRVLLVPGQACAINCRYCFRREFPYAEHRQSKQQWQQSLDYIRARHDINEVILSGGDPLIHDDDYLFWLLGQLDQIKHVSRIRIHSRLITTLPQRIDSHFLGALEQLHTPLVMVTHCNHANELGDDVAHALQQLNARKVTLLNQSVLLRAVNDQVITLQNLSERLFEVGVLPYYLFTLDKVNGAAHFDIPLDEIRKLYKGLLACLPGYLVPKLVTEVPGQPSKTPVILTETDTSGTDIPAHKPDVT